MSQAVGGVFRVVGVISISTRKGKLTAAVPDVICSSITRVGLLVLVRLCVVRLYCGRVALIFMESSASNTKTVGAVTPVPVLIGTSKLVSPAPGVHKVQRPSVVNDPWKVPVGMIAALFVDVRVTVMLKESPNSEAVVANKAVVRIRDLFIRLLRSAFYRERYLGRL